MISPVNNWCIASEKETVEQPGSELEKKEKDTKMDSKAPNYYYPIIEKLEKWIIIKRSKIGTM